MSDREFSGSDELSLPKATVQKIISEIIPSDLTFSRETRDALIECCIEFIMILSTESNDIAEKENKKTIASEHVVQALEVLGFTEYIDPIKEVVHEHKESQKGRERKVGKLESSGMTEEELLKKQEELFGLARSKLHQGSGVA
ncbi:histone-fold-containing protein [Nadsonia fulvescens var. elongata DSM 6958]|uniref:Histone-fold-containing protein n=1 Tax=Nadsonia fulvescens var. elongata DSM 6958 TaxID=857566 RepID=A0A1E3PDS8_9ASCO|nr:histone-fold-containing protein [Nadsonia fulvescens var. elongata DSM 6958]